MYSFKRLAKESAHRGPRLNETALVKHAAGGGAGNLDADPVPFVAFPLNLGSPAVLAVLPRPRILPLFHWPSAQPLGNVSLP
jgi:hypothetical protein